FPSEIQSSVAAQLADCLLAVVSQRLHFRSDLNIRVPECEVLIATHAIKNFVRNRDFFKIVSALETGADHGMWTFQRYRKWLDARKQWHIPGATAESPDSEPAENIPPGAALPKTTPASPRKAEPTISTGKPGGPIEIEPVEGGFEKILKKLE